MDEANLGRSVNEYEMKKKQSKTLHTGLVCTSFGSFGGTVYIATSLGSPCFTYIDIAISPLSFNPKD